ncbi:MAG: hypothetical protein EA391_07910 [Balneolaceae bacterium]|nr:MAG: hypothetical protein EA391_07910 [Balneolaceae bacterium]
MNRLSVIGAGQQFGIETTYSVLHYSVHHFSVSPIIIHRFLTNRGRLFEIEPLFSYRVLNQKNRQTFNRLTEKV